MSDQRLVEAIFFLACTRPALVLGVTMEAFGLNVMFSSILFILAGSLLYGLVAIPIHLACRLVCRHDPNQFRILFAWFPAPHGWLRHPLSGDDPREGDDEHR